MSSVEKEALKQHLKIMKLEKMKKNKIKMYRHEQISLESKIWMEYSKLKQFEKQNPGKIAKVIKKLKGTEKKTTRNEYSD